MKSKKKINLQITIPDEGREEQQRMERYVNEEQYDEIEWMLAEIFKL